MQDSVLSDGGRKGSDVRPYLKPKRRTRERIKETALVLFNRFGEPSVTTAAIAAEMGISHGNLYYHYRSKEKIVEDLFAAYIAEIEGALAAPKRRPPHVEDVWLFLHLVFETIYRYRFLYRDLNELLSRHRIIESRFKRVLAHQRLTAERLLEGLVAAGELAASRVEIAALAENMTLVATYWLSYAFASDPRAPQDGATLAHGVFQAMSLAAPHLSPEGRKLFDHLAQPYMKPGAAHHGEEASSVDRVSTSPKVL